jgi:hypothetical protein
MRLPMRVHHLPGHGTPRQVLVPVVPLSRLHVTKVLWRYSGALIGSRADLLRLGALFRLAAVSPQSVVYLPLRQNAQSEAASAWNATQGLADLVIARREAALRPSAWPAHRVRLRHGPKAEARTTMLAPAPRLLAQPEDRRPVPDWELVRYRLRLSEHADTLFLSGSAQALHDAGDELTWCGDQVAVNANIHRFGGPTMLSQFNGPDRRAGRRDASWEMMVLAEDQIFHRSRWAAKQATKQ